MGISTLGVAVKVQPSSEQISSLYSLQADNNLEIGIRDDQEAVSLRQVFKKHQLTFATLVPPIPLHVDLGDYVRLDIMMPDYEVVVLIADRPD